MQQNPKQKQLLLFVGDTRALVFIFFLHFFFRELLRKDRTSLTSWSGYTFLGSYVSAISESKNRRTKAISVGFLRLGCQTMLLHRHNRKK